MTEQKLLNLAMKARGHEDWLGQLWLERGAVLERIAAGVRPEEEFARIARRVREEGTLGAASGRVVREIPVDPGRFL